jgi:hypothetical protein
MNRRSLLQLALGALFAPFVKLPVPTPEKFINLGATNKLLQALEMPLRYAHLNQVVVGPVYTVITYSPTEEKELLEKMKRVGSLT